MFAAIAIIVTRTKPVANFWKKLPHNRYVYRGDLPRNTGSRRFLPLANPRLPLGNSTDEFMVDYSEELDDSSEAKFRKPVVPGDQLHIYAEVKKERKTMIVLSGHIEVEGEKVCEAEVMAFARLHADSN